jgi:hypothetical protein
MYLQTCGNPVDACLELKLWEPRDDGADKLVRPKWWVYALDLAGDPLDLLAAEELVLEGNPLWCHYR